MIWKGSRWSKRGCDFGTLLLNLCTWEQGCLFSVLEVGKYALVDLTAGCPRRGSFPNLVLINPRHAGATCPPRVLQDENNLDGYKMNYRRLTWNDKADKLVKFTIRLGVWELRCIIIILFFYYYNHWVEILIYHISVKKPKFLMILQHFFSNLVLILNSFYWLNLSLEDFPLQNKILT